MLTQLLRLLLAAVGLAAGVVAQRTTSTIVFPQEGLLNQPQGGVDLVALAAKHIRRTFVAGGVDTTLGTLHPVGSPAEVRQLLGHVDPGQDSAVEMVVVTDAARGLALGLATACSPPRDDGLAGYAVCVTGSVVEVVGASDVATPPLTT